MKKCPFCSEEIQDDAIKCRHCGEWLNKEKRSNTLQNTFNFPKIWPGYLLALLFFIFEVIEVIFNPQAAEEIYSGWAILLSLIGLVYWCVCVYKIHKTLLKMSDNHYPISPARAVGFGFIPFYNLYWIFKWPSEIINLVNSRDTSRKLNTWLPGLFLLVSGFLGRIDGTLWLLVNFAVLSYLVKSIKGSLIVKPGIAPYKDQPTRLSTGVVVAIVCLCFIPILGLLAAIAIPNFIAARETAQRNACVNNMRMIDAAKQQWSLENYVTGDASVTAGDIAPYIRGGMPTCFGGGTYTIGTLDELPSCTIHGELPKGY